jgi:lipid-binding SYLF domain-containing protein
VTTKLAIQVTISGVGWGLQIGAEVADVMLILTNPAAVETFKSRAQVTPFSMFIQVVIQYK